MSFVFNPITGKLDIKGGGQGMKFTVAAVTSSPNVWVNVPSPGITEIADIQIFDQLNMEKVEIEARIVAPSQAQIRSNKTKTFTVHVEGY